MGRYIAKRLLWMIPVVLGITILIFTIMYFTPGDPAASVLGNGATQLELSQKREEMGLNRPYIVRLGEYMKDVFLKFDLGDSYVYNTPVISEITSRMPRTFLIALICMILQIGVGIPLGIYAAVHQNKLGDRVSMFIALFGVSMPQFWVALMLILFFSVKLGWLPAYGIGGLQYYILPCIANSFAGIATQTRQTRSSMLEVIRSDYITTAQAKGLSKRDVLFKHALPNALIPVITIIGNGFGMMLAGTIVIEAVFSIPGIGSYMMSGINNRDYPVVQGCVIFLGITFSLIMLLVDLIYAFVDPRIKAQYESGKKRRTKNA